MSIGLGRTPDRKKAVDKIHGLFYYTRIPARVVWLGAEEKIVWPQMAD
jgi:hypothetical protein